MRTLDQPPQVWCDGCGAEITWAPVLRDERDYCCEDCAEGRPCRCGERMELPDERRARSGPDFIDSPV
jgi:hypothetical protein